MLLQLWFELQPAKVQRRLLKQKKGREIAAINAQERKRLIHLASFHRWEADDQKRWLQIAIYTNVMKAKDMKQNSSIKGLDMYQQAYVNTCFEPVRVSTNKILTRFALPCNGINPEATPEELQVDLMQAIKSFTTEICGHLIRRFSNRKLYRVSYS